MNLVFRAATVSGLEDPERLLRHGRRVTPTARRTRQIATSAKQLAQEPNNIEDEVAEIFYGVAGRVVPEEGLALPAAALVTPLSSEQLFIRDAFAGIPDHFEEALTRMLIDLNANQSAMIVISQLCWCEWFSRSLTRC